MELSTTLYEWLSSSDAHFLELATSDLGTLPMLDGFFKRATSLQLQRNRLKALSKEAQASLDEETQLVFLVYMRILSHLQIQRQGDSEKRSEPLLRQSMLHMTRIVPFCQLYARNNATSVRTFVDNMMETVEGFDASIGKLHDVFLKLSGLITSERLARLLLLNNSKSPEQLTQSESLVRALVVCYESDLPILQRELVRVIGKVQAKILIIAETRRLLLQVLARFMDLIMKKQEYRSSEEMLLEVLHSIAHYGAEDNMDRGSFVGDLCHLCNYKEKISSFLESGDIEKKRREHLTFFEVIFNGLPRRRIVPIAMHSDK